MSVRLKSNNCNALSPYAVFKWSRQEISLTRRHVQWLSVKHRVVRTSVTDVVKRQSADSGCDGQGRKHSGVTIIESSLD
jgi:hypothetical protein